VDSKCCVSLYGRKGGSLASDQKMQESAAHIASSKKAGVSEDEIAALRAEQDSPFSPAERAAIQYARELTRTADAGDTRDALIEYFSSAPIVEITLVVAMANFTNRFNNGLELKPEE